MESSEISTHQVRLFEYLKVQKGKWCTSNEAAVGAKIAARTARHHLQRFVQAGLVDEAEVFPGHRYRLSDLAGKRNKTLLQRLQRAAEVLNGAN